MIVFIAISITHMALPRHKSDCHKAPNEYKVMNALGLHAIPPGDYMIPRCSSMQEQLFIDLYCQ